MSTILRPPADGDMELLGGILYEAFREIAESHGFAPDFPSQEMAEGFIRMMIADPEISGVVAEEDGRILGSNFLWQGDPIQGVGPITIDLQAQSRGVGRRLMERVLEWAADAPGVRLVQDSFHMRSLALYASLGFELKEPLVLMEGNPRSGPKAEHGRTVRRYEEGDLEGCLALSREVHGFERGSELRKRLPMLDPWVVVREGRVAAYATGVQFWALSHGVAESDDDMQALMLAAAENGAPLSFLLPVRQAEFFRWCLWEGLRADKPMNLMAKGKYLEPRGCWFPSVLY